MTHRSSVAQQAAGGWTPPAGLAAWYYGDSLTDGKWTDRSGTGNHAVLVGSPTLSANGLALNGTDQRAYVAANATLAFAEAYTVCAWVRQSAISGGTPFGVVARRLGQAFWALYARQSYWRGETQNGGGTVTGRTIRAVELDVWHHLAISMHGTGYVVYADGSPTAEQIGTVTIASNATSKDIDIGYDAASGAASHLPGDLDDIQLYGAALSGEQIAALYANSPGSHA